MANHTPPLAEWLDALERVTGKAPRRSGDEFRALCPAHGGDGFSLAVVERNGRILTTCHSGDCSHDAIRAALGFDGAESRNVERRYEYRTADGGLHLTVCMKRDAETGKKVGRPWREPRGVKGPHPLYRLPELLETDRARTALVVEGEYTCDRAREAWPGEPVVTWCGGAKAWRTADWAPLTGRPVTVAADADTQGREAARAIGAHLVTLGCDVALALPDGESGDDLADWLREGPAAALERLQACKNDAPASDAAPAGIPTMTLSELFDRPEDASTWLLDGVVPAGGFAVLTGKPKSGKSTLARFLAHAVATGRPCLNRQCAQGAAIYIALEERAAEVRRHYMALGTPRDAPLRIAFQRPPGDAVQLLRETIEATAPALVMCRHTFPICSGRGRKRLRDRAQDAGADRRLGAREWDRNRGGAPRPQIRIRGRRSGARQHRNFRDRRRADRNRPAPRRRRASARDDRAVRRRRSRDRD